jgi:hypothetical protein
MQSVKKNLILSSTDSSQSVRIDQIASYAVEKTVISSASQDDDQFIVVNDSKSTDSNEMKNSVNQKTNNHLISEKNNSLILNYSRSKIRPDYKQLHHKSFVKSAKFESIKAVNHDVKLMIKHHTNIKVSSDESVLLIEEERSI